MNWARIRWAPWLDTRAKFVASVPQGANFLDIGSSTGETLGHIAELRPDFKFFSTDLAGAPDKYPKGCQFHRGNLEKDRLPWPDASLDAITCMHLIEHLNDHKLLFSEVARLLKPGGKIYLETPHPRSLTLSSAKGSQLSTFTLSFHDDLTHIKIFTMGGLAKYIESAGLQVLESGTSRNWLFVASHPFFMFLPPSRQKYTAKAHWVGWSAYLIAQRPR